MALAKLAPQAPGFSHGEDVSVGASGCMSLDAGERYLYASSTVKQS